MKLRDDLLQGIGRFLALVPVGTRQRGRDYFTGGNVLELKCVEPDHLYAAVVRGGEDYEVGLEFADQVWVSKCSCPMQYDCKHTVAAMLELQRRALAAIAPPVRDPVTPAIPARRASFNLRPVRRFTSGSLKILDANSCLMRSRVHSRVQTLYALANRRQPLRTISACIIKWLFGLQPLGGAGSVGRASARRFLLLALHRVGTPPAQGDLAIPNSWTASRT